jgi:hypothetical protein
MAQSPNVFQKKMIIFIFSLVEDRLKANFSLDDFVEKLSNTFVVGHDDDDSDDTRAQCYKTFCGCKLRMFNVRIRLEYFSLFVTFPS